MSKTILASEIIDFWFTPPMSSHWFSSSSDIDQDIKARYEFTWEQARDGLFDHWKELPEGCLALCIVLDQLPLNMFRGQSKSFSTEQMAVDVVKHAIDKGFDEEISRNQVAFLFMPLMHSEILQDQHLSVNSFEKTNLEGNIRFAKHHREIVRKFGRFPHRNEILGRESSPEELVYLKSDEAFTG